MQNSDEKHKYIEDDFELDLFKKNFRRVKLRNARRRKDKKTVKALSVLIAILFVCAVFFAYQSLDYYAEIKRNASANKEAREILSDIAEPTAAPAVTSAAALPETVPDVALSAEEYAPDIEEPKVLLEEILKLRENFSNDDIIGYLKIDGTNIDYAVAQTSDNAFYLDRDLYTEKNITGSIFMDYESDAYELGRHTVIYGHNMKNGSMFHNIRYYVNPEYYDEHRYISLTTPYEETTWEIFAFYRTTTDFNYIQVIFPNTNSFEALVSEMKRRAEYDMGVEATANDKILTLSTCANTAENARLVVNAKLVEK